MFIILQLAEFTGFGLVPRVIEAGWLTEFS
jgi:hypothetical protein